ncbi:MAG: hypothetical protein ACLTK0_07750 [Anaerovoracaceae bacterium]
MDQQAVDILTKLSNGDARVALDTVGFIAENVDRGESLRRRSGEAMQRKMASTIKKTTNTIF